MQFSLDKETSLIVIMPCAPYITQIAHKMRNKRSDESAFHTVVVAHARALVPREHTLWPLHLTSALTWRRTTNNDHKRLDLTYDRSIKVHAPKQWTIQVHYCVALFLRGSGVVYWQAPARYIQAEQLLFDATDERRRKWQYLLTGAEMLLFLCGAPPSPMWRLLCR